MDHVRVTATVNEKDTCSALQVHRLALALSLLLICSCGYSPFPKEGQGLASKSKAGSDRRPTDARPRREIRVAIAQERAITTPDLIAEATTELQLVKSTTVAMPSNGRVVRVTVKKGDLIVRGQILLYWEIPHLTAVGGSELEIDVDRLKQKVREAQVTFDEAVELFARRQIPKTALIEAEARLERAEAALANAEIDTLKESNHQNPNLATAACSPEHLIPIKSAVSGQVFDEFKSEGRTIGMGTPVLTIATLKMLQVVFAVSKENVSSIELGETVQVDLDASPDQLHHAFVVRIDAQDSPSVQTVRIYAEFTEIPRHLWPGMSGMARLSGRIRLVRAIPVGALVDGEEDSYVYLQNAAGHFEKRLVQIVRRTDQSALIGKGLEAGDRVAIDGKAVQTIGLHLRKAFAKKAAQVYRLVKVQI